MKYIIAIIQPHRTEEVLEALYKADIHLVTVSEVLGHGRQKGLTEVYRGHREMGALLHKIKVEIAVNDAFVKPALEAIEHAGHTGNVGDGKVFVLDLKECVRIRTGERGSKAIG